MFISIHRALLSEGKPLLLVEECGKAEPSLALTFPAWGCSTAPKSSSLLLLILQGRLRFWLRFGLLSSCSIQDFSWEEFVAQAAGEKGKSPKWEVSLQSCPKPVSSRFQIHMKVGIRELQLQRRYLKLLKLK